MLRMQLNESHADDMISKKEDCDMTWILWILLTLTMGGAAWLCIALHTNTDGPAACIGCGECIAAGECVLAKNSRRKAARKDAEPS